MRRLLLTVCSWWLALLWGGLLAQQTGYPLIRNYQAREFKASSANYTAAQDHRGLMYFGNFRGILEHDGANWRLISTPRHAKVSSLATDSLGRVYVGANGDFGYLHPDSLGRQQFHSLLDRLPDSHRQFSSAVRVIGSQAGAYFQVVETRQLYYYTPDTLINHDLGDLTENVILFLMEGHLHASVPGRGLLRLARGDFQPVPGGEALAQMNLLATVPMDAHQYLIRTFEQGFFELSFERGQVELKRWRTEIDGILAEGMFSEFIRLHNGHLLVSVFKQGAYEIDRQGRRVMHYHEGIGLQDNIVLGSFQDQQRSLWLMLSKGIARVEVGAPLTHFGENAGLPGIVFATIRHQDYLYAGTPLGIFRLRGRSFEPVAGMESETWQFFQVPGRNGEPSHLLANTARGIYEIRGGRGYPIAQNDFFINLATSPALPHAGVALVGNAGGQTPRLIRYAGGRWRWTDELPALEAEFSDVMLTPAGKLWLLYADQTEGRLMRLEPSAEGAYVVAQRYQARDIPAVRGMYHLAGRTLFATQGGLYEARADGKLRPATPLNQVLGKYRAKISHLRSDPKGRIWVERQEGYLRHVEVLLPQAKGGYQRDSLMLRELADAEIWSRVYPEPNGLVWIGTSDGLYCYDTEFRSPDSVALSRPLIRQVTLNEDSLLYGGTAPRTDSAADVVQLKADQNSLTFHYVAPQFNQENNLQYRYRLVGREDEWSPWTTERKKDFTLLPPGQYEFQVQARNPAHVLSETSSYGFHIAPPWYRQPWAFMVYGLLAILLVYGTVKLNTRRLHLKNEHLERLVYERTTEIWEQHKEIVKTSVALKRQKEAVAEQASLLEEKNKALNDALDKLKAAQAQLVESEKMASLGQLTAGIAHEINNPINYVKNNVTPLKRDFADIRTLFLKIRQLKEEETDLRRAVRKIQQFAQEVEADYLFEEMELLLKGIEEGAQRTKEIVDGLKTFSRSEKDHFKLVDIHAGLESTLRLLNNKTKDRIQVERSFADIPVVECLPGKLNQVFMNVISNAIQAIEDRAKQEEQGRLADGVVGRISLHTEMADHCLPGHKDCVRITVQDTGVGIPAELRSRIFEPFFTTKEVGKGTGLGLAISFGIIEQHQGRIEVVSEAGQGATFRLILPFRQEPEPVATSS